MTCCFLVSPLDWADNNQLKTNLCDFVRQNATPSHFTGGDSWVILSPIEQSIKAKIEKTGTPLRDWDIQIYRGILTGCNDAFIIGKTKRQEILDNCLTTDERKRTDELIRPILRGRDIKRYAYEWADLYLLFIPWHFPLHNDISVVGASKNAELAFMRQYESLYDYLLQYKEELSNRNRAETGIRYEWYALQRWGANYWEDFSKPKIIWIELVDRPSFALDNSGIMINNTVFFITGKYVHFLIAYLNSSLCDWQFGKICATSGMGTRRWIKQYVEQICVPLPTNDHNLQMEKIIESLNNASESAKIKIFSMIDDIIFALFDFTLEEQNYLKTQFLQN
jgi:hypothetical protein